jgi:hypothetical protein
MHNSINVNYLENVISNFKNENFFKEYRTTMQPCDYSKIIELVKQTTNDQTSHNECGVVYNNEYSIVHLYNHLLKIIKLPQSTEELLVEPITNICIEEQRLISLNTIQINNITLLAVHYEIKTGIKNVIFFTINLENMSI